MANPVIDGKRADSARRRERVLKAIDAAVKSGGDITISGLAPHGSSRPDIPLYRHPNLLERVHVAASAPRTGLPAIGVPGLRPTLGVRCA
ncbi:hypothetical protein MRQ86_31425 [Streptomyces sp. MMS21 TC-5]|uniref:hypothetical protein n=1 Tax=Streptomyces TaxID=1883 RepID=UPI000A8E945F|nr:MULTISPECIES: hypothetical protein [Streptomyces]MCI4084741.1 hypothetical protein [Streptomyces sp. MMS21 TC-5]RST03271.1 hypothetical protein EF904_21375 [Streptomyces sp. WAC05950]